MKKSLIIPFLAIMAVTACKKTENTVSTLRTYSTPTVTVTGNLIYYSIPVGGVLPTIAATAYDSFYNETDNVVIDQSTLDNTTPGLYIINATAQNKYGMTGSTVIYVAVTNIDPAINLAGTYERTSNSAVVHVAKVGNGLYTTNDVGGAPTLQVMAVFAQLDDTTIVLPSQPTSAGPLFGSDAGIVMAPADTAFHYVVNNASFGTALRTFVKQ